MARFNLLKVFLFFGLISLCPGGYSLVVMAQENSDNSIEFEQQSNSSIASMIDESVEFGEESDLSVEAVTDEYVEGNHQDLARLYWALNKFDLDDRKAIENFLVITECNIYQRYRNDEFEWIKIYNAAREFIKNNRAMWPTTFEIIVPIYLDRYDIENEVFKLKKDSWFEGARRLYVHRNRRQIKLCGFHRASISGYPENMVFILDKPFTFTEISMVPELAAFYIDASNRRYKDLPSFLQATRYRRYAYLRLKVRIFSYQSTGRVSGAGMYEKATVRGRLEGIEVYADMDKIKLLYSKDVPRDRRVRRKRRSEDKDN